MPVQRWFTLRATITAPVVLALTATQHPSQPGAAAPIGTYALGTRSLASSRDYGCWLEVAPVSADSIHLQVLCRKPAPGGHLGVLDARLPWRKATLVYERNEPAGR